jgi:ABC-type multidrug transport system ATPase subunit
MYAFLTVFETLMLSAHFFLPHELSDEEKAKTVDSVIAELGLSKSRDTIIGNEKVRGISGGERKRASIAVQLLTDPAVLFLDEPTSGLDAFQSQAVMESLKTLVDHGRLVITVIHQPRSSIYEMFDKILILSEGKLMYHGDSMRAVDYFANVGYPCPESFNPADFYLDLLSPDNRSLESEEETRNRIQFLGNKWDEYSNALSIKSDGKEFEEEETFKTVKLIGSDSSWKKATRNTMLLFWRSFVQQARDIPTTMSKVLPAIFFALLIGGLYSNIGNSQKSIMNRKGVLYFILINQGFISINSVLTAFSMEKIIVGRERSGRAYSTLSYCVAKVLVELPLNIFPILVYSCILSPLVGLNPHTFGYFILICCMNAMVIIALGLVVSALAPNVDAANALSAPFMIIGILFGGFYIKISSLPPVLNLVPYVSAFKWAFQALSINEFKGQTFSCDLVPSTQCLLTGEQVLETLHFQGQIFFKISFNFYFNFVFC